MMMSVCSFTAHKLPSGASGPSVELCTGRESLVGHLPQLVLREGSTGGGGGGQKEGTQ